MSMPSDKPPLRSEASRLNKALNQAAQDSVLSGEPRAFGLSNQGYAFMRFQDNEWEAVKTAQWSEDVEPVLSKNGEPKKLTQEVLPYILFDPTGQSTLFDLTLSGANGDRFILSSAGDGRVRIESDPQSTL